MSHLTKALIGVTAAAGLTLAGCGTSGGFNSSSDSSMSMGPTAGMSEYNVQQYNDWHAGNINHEFWDTQVVFHPETNVYFDPYSQTYYWQNDGSWMQGNSLPQHMSLLRSTRKVVERRELLTKTGNAEYAMAFNPDYEMFVEEVSPILEAADSQVDYTDRPNPSLSQVDESDQN